MDLFRRTFQRGASLVFISSITIIAIAYFPLRFLSSSQQDCSVVYVTCSSQEEAVKIAHGVVSRNLAACVNIVPQVTSVYKWKGEIEQDQELLLVIKTVTQKLPDLEAEVKALHSYETFEFIALPITGGSSEYLRWLHTSVA